MARSTSFSPVLITLIGIGVAAGAAATFVVSSSVPYAARTPVNSEISPTVLGIILLSPFVLFLGWVVYRRATGGAVPVSRSAVVGALLILAMMVVLGILAGAFGSHPEYYSPGGGGGGVGGGGGGGGGGHSNNTSGSAPGLGPFSLQEFTLPGWVVLVAVAAVGLAMVGLAVPALADWSSRRRAGRGRGIGPAERSEARAALTRALDELDRGADPRLVIERLYVRFLDRVVPITGDLTMRTPEEIRADTLVPLGVRPAAAAQLTRIFEEARYSSHPIDATKAAGVREAVRLAASDLTRLSPAP